MSLRVSSPVNPHRGDKLVTAPAIEPVSAGELRTFLKEDVSEFGDNEANRLIQMARNFIEELTGIAFIEQTWLLVLDRWPGYNDVWWDGVREGHISEISGRPKPIQLSRYPLISVDTVTTYDEADNDTAVVVANLFNIDTASTPGRMMLKHGQTWPIASRGFAAVEIEYTAGFGDTAGAVPPTLRDAILTLAAYYYNHRGECDMKEAWQKSGASALTSLYVSRGI